jgi:pyruvate dehydrogenase E2 component (dihydrolipoamide acetyltransferase)
MKSAANVSIADQLPSETNALVSESRSYGEVEVRELSKIQTLVARNLLRSWSRIPHVTHHEELDITDLEVIRIAVSEKHGIRLTALHFVIRAVVESLRAFPQFNASLDDSGQHLILKKFYNIGVAVDTPRGLLVPVIRDVDRLDVTQIAMRLRELVAAAREKGLPMSAMSGASFSVSSLGSIGGTAFTPIINAPEAAILGMTRVRRVAAPGAAGAVEWRSMLPVSLSYDHRIINGADAARFCASIQAGIQTVKNSL